MIADIEIPKEFTEHYSVSHDSTDFDDDLYPPVSGSDHGSVELLGDIKESFQAVYYRLNGCYRSLSQLAPDDPARQRLLEESNELSRARDALEDACTPIGFIAEPVLSGLITTELKVTHAPVGHDHDEPPGSSFSLFIEIPAN